MPIDTTGQPIAEAGRVLSAANANALVAAWRTLGSVLSRALGAAPEDDTADTAESIREALSHGDIARALEIALRNQHPQGDGFWLYVMDTYDDVVVYRYDTPVNSATYQRTYTVTDDGAVTLGEPIEVVMRTEYVPVAGATEAASVTSDLVPLLERAVSDDGTVQIKLIQPGWGSSGYYSAEVLERDGPVVFTAGTHMYIDHPSESESIDRPERSVRDLAGRLTSDAYWDANGPAGAGLYAQAEVFSPYREMLDQIAPHIGVSIRAAGTIGEGEVDGRRGRLVDSLVHAESVDYVTRAGAGGQIIGLLESARGGTVPPARIAIVGEPGPAETIVPRASVAEDDMDLTEATARIADLEAQLATERQARVASEAQAAIAERLGAADLPAFAVRRITAELTANVPVTEAGALNQSALETAVDAAVETWRADLAGIAPTGTVRGMGGNGAADGSAALGESLNRVMGRFGLSEAGRNIAITGR